MSLLAGILTGIVGMASLTLYPVLLSVGVPPVSANATITVAQVVGNLGATLSSLQELSHHRHEAFVIALWNTIGGVLGAELLIHSSNAGFKKIVPVFILLAGILILVPTDKRTAKKNRQVQWLDWTALLLVGIYNGYFGAASGLLMIAVLNRIVKYNYAEINSLRNFASFCNNFVAAGMFIMRLKIDWSVLLPLIIGLFIGGFLGPMIVKIIPSKIIETAVGIFAIGLACLLTYKDYV